MKIPITHITASNILRVLDKDYAVTLGSMQKMDIYTNRLRVWADEAETVHEIELHTNGTWSAYTFITP